MEAERAVVAAAEAGARGREARGVVGDDDAGPRSRVPVLNDGTAYSNV